MKTNHKIGIIQADGSFYPFEVNNHAYHCILELVNKEYALFQIAIADSETNKPQIIRKIHLTINKPHHSLVLSLSCHENTCTVTVTDENSHLYRKEQFVLSQHSFSEEKLVLHIPNKKTSEKRFKKAFAEDLSPIELLLLNDKKNRIWKLIQIIVPIFLVIIAIAFIYLLIYFIKTGSIHNFFIDPFAPFL